ncbi:NAD-dependent epimerase/dehydratase family protein [Benzoatithermus flavus]|uniref:NAD-dependent epimerase/dehydratase family protein n=1 Tax=Benzoatithermus flavus TaxID=3108223 RepID=A0ABU8XRW3_9PROT
MILIVGRGFIGRAVAQAMRPDEVRLVGHEAVHDPSLLRGVRTVLFAGRHPALGTEAWSPDDDAELALAHRAAAARVSFVSLGTRKVYAPSVNPLNEIDRVGPVDLYGRQKLALEHALSQVLGRRLTRLRLANIFGYERISGRNSFLAQALIGLSRRDEIRFDMSPFVQRDFLPVELCARWLAEIARRPPGGVLNVGSGVALPTGKLALWLIEGYGRGRLVVESPEERDSFVLDTRNLKALLGGEGCSLEDLRRHTLAIGQRLRQEIYRR